MPNEWTKMPPASKATTNPHVQGAKIKAMRASASMPCRKAPPLGSTKGSAQAASAQSEGSTAARPERALPDFDSFQK